MKGIISAVICIAMLSVATFAYVPESSVEVNDAAFVFSYIDDLSTAQSQKLTSKGAFIVGTNWRMRNATETPGELAGQVNGDNTSPVEFGIKDGDLFLEPAFDGSQSHNETCAGTVPSLVLATDLSGMPTDHKITYEVVKSHFVVSSGIRFKVHNNGLNYYALILGGKYYRNDIGNRGWELLKFTNGRMEILKQGGVNTHPDFAQLADNSSATWKVEISVQGKTISFKVSNLGYSFSDSYTDERMFDVSGNDCGVWLMAANGNGGDFERNARFRNFKIEPLIPYLTSPEPENVMYIDAVAGRIPDSEGVYNLGNDAVVRKLVIPQFASGTADVYMSDDKTTWSKISAAAFDSSATWFNNKTAKSCKYIAFNPNITETVSVHAEVKADQIFEIPLKTTFMLYPKAGIATSPDEFVWTSSKPEIATVEDGMVTILRKGDVTITAQYNDVSFNCNIKVLGEIESAIKNNTVETYINSVKPVFDAINTAVSTNNKDALKAVFLNTGTAKIEDIVDIDAKKVTDLEPLALDAFVTRLMTYQSFPCAEINDVYYIADVIDKEYAIELLHKETDDTAFISTLEGQNDYLKLDLENKYYKEYKDEVAAILNPLSFTNAEDLKYQYKQAYVMAAFDKMLSNEMMEGLIKNCEAEIGYNKSHFDKIDSVGLYSAIIENKTELNSIDKIKDFIDNYNKPTTNVPSNTAPRPSGSGGGGGGGGSAMNVTIDKGTVTEIEKNSVVTPVKPAAFPDIDEKHWAYESILKLKSKNIINGYEDGYFKPENTVTRAEFIKMLALAVDDKVEGELPEFTDVDKDDWYYDVVVFGAVSGIITGYPDGSFRPDAPVTREEMAVMLFRAITKYSDDLSNNEVTSYSDVKDISDWALEAVEALSKGGVMSGSSSGFEPKREATRAETAKCICTLL